MVCYKFIGRYNTSMKINRRCSGTMTFNVGDAAVFVVLNLTKIRAPITFANPSHATTFAAVPAAVEHEPNV